MEIKDRNTLGKLLATAEDWHKQAEELLKTLPTDLPEYNEVIDREAKLFAVINQLKAQLADRAVG